MVYTGHIKPNNKIVAAGTPLVQELKVETNTTMYPGRLVKKGTGDDEIVVSTDTTGVASIGWLGYEQTAPIYRPETVDTMYAADDMVAVLNGGGFVIVASLAAGQSVNKEDALTSTAAGELKAITATTDEAVAYAEETVNATGAAADIMVRSVI